MISAYMTRLYLLFVVVDSVVAYWWLIFSVS